MTAARGGSPHVIRPLASGAEMIFGNRNKKQTQGIDWPSLQSLLEDDDRRAAVEQLYPESNRESFLTAVSRLDDEVARKVIASGRQLHTAAQLIDWPTVAVAGMLNSGKTSLVATFLSEQGRARTLRGPTNAQGTHRFVLWLPSAWQEDVELWSLLIHRIGDALGRPPEMLAEDPAEAHRQYNNREGDESSLSVPLVATDPMLDRYHIGLLDCPDIVSDEAFGLGSPQRRRELLGRAAALCSAFLVVTSVESSRDQTLGDLMRIASDLMPGIPRMLAVNKVRAPQSPEQVLETFQPLARNHGIETIYVAYDFEVPACRPFIPQVSAENDVASGSTATRATGADEAGPAQEMNPVFYSVSENQEENPPAAIGPERLLTALPTQLDRPQLFERFQLALQSGLRSALWDVSFPLIDKDAHRSLKQTAAAQLCLLDAALEFFAQRDPGGDVNQLRLHQSERIIRQLSESFIATAPWYARWSIRLNTGIRRFIGGAGDAVRSLVPSAVAQRTAGDLRERFQTGEHGGLITPERLVRAIERHGGLSALPHWASDSGIPDQDRILQTCEESIGRFDREDFTMLDPHRLDEAVRKMWSEVPMHRKLATGLTPLAAAMATFGGVLMIPVDFGVSVIASASIAELFAAAGLTALSTYWAGGQTTRDVGRQAARQQLTDFHAILCDSFGVARPIEPPVIKVSGRSEPLVDSKVPQHSAQGPTLPVYRIRDEFLSELNRLIPRASS